MADQYSPAANVPAGASDTSDAFGPTLTGSGQRPAVIPGYPSDVATGDQSYSPTASADASITVPRAVFHDDRGQAVVHADMTADSSNPPPTADRDGDDGLPDVPRYEGPDVPDATPMVNPSAGNQGPLEGGMTDLNPQGPAPTPGVGPSSDRVVYPDTTQGYPNG